MLAAARSEPEPPECRRGSLSGSGRPGADRNSSRPDPDGPSLEDGLVPPIHRARRHRGGGVHHRLHTHQRLAEAALTGLATRTEPGWLRVEDLHPLGVARQFKSGLTMYSGLRLSVRSPPAGCQDHPDEAAAGVARCVRRGSALESWIERRSSSSTGPAGGRWRGD